MTQAQSVKGNIWEDTGAILTARFVDMDDVALLQADVSAIAYKVFDLDGVDPNTPIVDSTLNKIDVIFDTLKTEGWDSDTVGYNFRALIPAASFPEGGRRYEVDIQITTTGGDDHVQLYEVFARARRAS